MESYTEVSILFINICSNQLTLKSDLVRLVASLERERNDVCSELRDTEWKLDREAKVTTTSIVNLH